MIPSSGEEDLVEVRELDAPLVGLDGILALHLPRRLVVAQTLERRRAQMPVVRPLGELDLAHELRLDPDDVALAHLRHLRHLRERRAVACERLELREQLVDVALVEAGAARSRPSELAALDRRRARARRSFPRAGPAPSSSRRSTNSWRPCVLTLSQSRVRLPSAYREPRPLRHHALEALLLRRLEAAPRRRRRSRRPAPSRCRLSSSASSRSRRSASGRSTTGTPSISSTSNTS